MNKQHTVVIVTQGRSSMEDVNIDDIPNKMIDENFRLREFLDLSEAGQNVEVYSFDNFVFQFNEGHVNVSSKTQYIKFVSFTAIQKVECTIISAV